MEEATRLKYYLALSVYAGHHFPHVGAKKFYADDFLVFWIHKMMDPSLCASNQLLFCAYLFSVSNTEVAVEAVYEATLSL